MQLELDFFVSCDLALISQDNKLSVIGIFDQIYVTGLPSAQPKMSLVGTVRGEADSKHTVKLSIKSPSNEEILPKQNLQVSLGQNGKANIISEIAQFPIAEQGIYTIELSEENKTLATRELVVRLVGGTEGGAGKSQKQSN